MLTLVLLAAGVVGVNAGKLYADLSKLGNGPESTWNGSTNTMTWTATSNNMISNFNFAAGNYRAFSTISITVSDLTNAVGIRVQIKANGQEKLVALNGNGTFTKYLTDDFGFTAVDLTKVEWIRVLGSAYQNGENHTINGENPASAVISDVYLTEPTRTFDVNLGKMNTSEGNATWDFSTKKFAWTGTWSNAITLPGLSGSLSSFTMVNYETVAGTCDHFRILVYYNNGAAQTTYNASVGNKTLTFKEMGISAENLSHIASIKISGASDATGDITLKSFSLEGPAVNYIEGVTVQVAPEGAKDVNDIEYTENKKWNIAYPQTVSNETLFGGDIDSDNQSLNISDYDYLHFVVTDASSDAKTGLRVFVTDNKSTRQTLYPHPIDEAATNNNWTATTWITTPGTYVVKISGNPLLRGFKALQGWAGNAGTITVSQVYLTSGSVKAPEGKYTIVGAETITDPNATCFDVTSLSETGITYNPANPNALLIAKANQLTNTKNVIVGNTCANLQLTDNYSFMAPKNFTATAASYTTTINTTAQAGTLCLPFTATLPSGVQAYTLTYSSGNAATATEVEGTIAANTPVLLNGSGEVTFTGSGAVAANAENKSGAMTGVFAQGFVPKNSYVLQLLNNELGFRKVADDGSVSINPFRAYLTAQSASSRLSINFGEVTGIETVATAEKNEGKAYDLQGRRVAQPTKGLYIVNGKKYFVK